MVAIARRKQRREQVFARDTEINVVSLIDIFAILVFYLLVNALVVEIIPRYQNLVLPVAAARQQPPETVVLAVTRDAIFVGQDALMARRDVSASGGDALAPLVAALRAARLSTSAQGGDAEAAAGTVVNIVADREIPFGLLKRLLASCEQAGFSQLRLIVEQREAS